MPSRSTENAGQRGLNRNESGDVWMAEPAGVPLVEKADAGGGGLMRGLTRRAGGVDVSRQPLTDPQEH